MLHHAFRIIFLLVLVTSTAAGQGLAKSDRDFIIKHLKQTQKELHAAVKGVNDEQWKWKPAPERWSVGECVEHLVKAETFLRNFVSGDALKKPATPEKKNPAKAKEQDEAILKQVADRTRRAQAPEQAAPTGQWPDRKALLKEFDARRKATIEFARTAPADLRAYFFDSGPLAGSDYYQILLVISSHTQRHIAQMREVMAEPNFPKKKKSTY
jgi:uncharacterized damage-inducible protein DinB